MRIFVAVFFSLMATLARGEPPSETYTVYVIPKGSPSALHNVWRPILDRLATETGLRLELKAVRDYPAFEAALANGLPDFAFMNPYHMLVARRAQKYDPLVRDRADVKRGILVVRKDSPIREIGELKGARIAFATPNAFIGSLYLRAPSMPRGFPSNLTPPGLTATYCAMIDPRANAGLGRAFADRLVEKTYLAITRAPVRRPPVRFRIEAPLGAAALGREGVRVGGERAKRAETDVLVREVLEGALLVEARPHTGRRHQLRVHLAHAGMPILGDPVYNPPPADVRAGSAGPAGPKVPRLMLHAWRLALAHPISGKPLVIDSPIPPHFAPVLAALRRTH